MKRIAYTLILVTALSGCQTSDREIRADIAVKAMDDLNFAGLQFTVQDGVVNLSGHCPSAKALAEVRQTLSNIHVIKAVNYQVTIKPVLLDSLTPIKNKVDSILADYPQVTAEVSHSAITLKGVTTAPEKIKLLTALTANNVALVKDSLNLSR